MNIGIRLNKVISWVNGHTKMQNQDLIFFWNANWFME